MVSLALSRPKDVQPPPKRGVSAPTARHASALEQLLASQDQASGVGFGATLKLAPEVFAADPLLPGLFAAPPLTLRLEGPAAEAGWSVSEASLPGLWLLRPGQGQASSGTCHLELTSCPARIAMHAASAALPLRAVPLDPPAPGLGALWAGLRLGLIAGARETKVLNLSVPVLKPLERDALVKALGEAAVLGRLEGQLLRQIASTRLQRVWRVQYLDANARVQLDTLEIGVLPECLVANAAELAGTIARLCAMVRGQPGEIQQGRGLP